MFRDFTENDIKCIDQLFENIKFESQCIYESPMARKNRSFEEVQDSVRKGKIAEQFLIENYDFKKSKLKWHDLENSLNEQVEVKAYNINDIYAPSVNRDLQRYRESAWCKSKWYILFSLKDGIYKHIATIRIK